MGRPVMALLPALRIEECLQLTSEGLRTCGDLMSLGVSALSVRFGRATAEALIKAASSLWPEAVPRVASHACEETAWPLSGAPQGNSMASHACEETAWPPASQRPSTSQPLHAAQPLHPAQPGAQSSFAHGKRKAVAPPPAAPPAQVITPDDPLITPDDPLITPDDPLITPDDPLITPDDPLITPDDRSTGAGGVTAVHYRRRRQYEYGGDASRLARLRLRGRLRAPRR